tara:strand:+ start:382 stop:930 length:549 start_codon:yes stop_codon:yes gene_type:complete
MKRKIKIILSLPIILLTVWGCAGGVSSGSTEQTTSDEPEWWFNPADSETHYYGFGQAKKQNPSLAQKAAKQRAKQSISSDVKDAITSEIRDYMSESGLGDNAQALEFSESTTISLSDNVLTGASSDKYYKAKDGTVYVRVKYSKDAVSKGILNAAKKEEALYNEFKASQAFDRMERKVSGGN